MEWVDGNIGSKVTMKYPAVYLMGEHARGETLSVAFAGAGQHQDAGAKMVHCAPHTSSQIISKSVPGPAGRTSSAALARVRGAPRLPNRTSKGKRRLVTPVTGPTPYPSVAARGAAWGWGTRAA